MSLIQRRRPWNGWNFIALRIPAAHRPRVIRDCCIAVNFGWRFWARAWRKELSGLDRAWTRRCAPSTLNILPDCAPRKIEAAGLTLMSGGVIYLDNKEEDVRAAFEYAKDAGMPTIVCSPEPAALDTVEKMARQYGIRVAIHNHGPGDKRYPSPLDVFRLVKDRHTLMGLCIDVGHTVRIGQDPVAAIEQCASRLYDFHIKDVTEATAKGAPIEVGRGVIDVAAVLKTLVELKYSYHLALEYEANGDAPIPGIIESFAYMRGVLSAIA